jgi:hypothetical protein
MKVLPYISSFFHKTHQCCVYFVTINLQFSEGLGIKLVYHAKKGVGAEGHS